MGHPRYRFGALCALPVLLGSCFGRTSSTEDVVGSGGTASTAGISGESLGSQGGSGADASGLPSTADRACSEIRQAVKGLIDTHRSCGDTGKCQKVFAFCLLEDRTNCGGDFYVNTQLDLQQFEALEAELTACSPRSECAACLASSPPAACEDGMCVPWERSAECETAREYGRELVSRYSYCDEADDCRLVHWPCLNDGYDLCSSWYSVNQDFTTEHFNAIESQLPVCHPSVCIECDDLGTPAPTCVDHGCGFESQP